MRQVVPGLRRLAVLSDVDNPFTVLELGATQKAAYTLGIEVDAVEIRQDKDVAAAFDAFRDRAEIISYAVAKPGKEAISDHHGQAEELLVSGARDSAWSESRHRTLRQQSS